jgi:hypothetical protein
MAIPDCQAWTLLVLRLEEIPRANATARGIERGVVAESTCGAERVP